jgi:LacI family transcriptional regulator
MPKPSKRGATIVDIARTLGVSAMTVSRALSGHPEVAEATRARVVDCAKMLGYRPNRWARSLVTRRSSIIGIIVPDIAHSYFAEITRGVEDVLGGAEFDLLLCHSGQNWQKERAEMNMLIGSQVDGLIIASEQPQNDPGHLLELRERRIPFVLIDRFFPDFDFPSVHVDDLQVGRIATEYLIRNGHRSIAHLYGPGFSPATLRKRGFEEAMRDAGLPLEQHWILPGRFDVGSAVESAQKLITSRPRPTAIFAGNDQMAVGAARACRDIGLRIPQDISIIGAGNIEGTYHPYPFLTTIDWPRQELGRTAASLLVQMILEPEKEMEPLLPLTPRLLIRQSAGRYRKPR